MKNNNKFLKKLHTKLNPKIVINTNIIILICIQILLGIMYISNNTSLITIKNHTYITITLCILSLLILLTTIFSFNIMMSSMKGILKNSRELYEGNLNINDIIIWENSDFKVLAKTLNSMKSNLLFFVDNTKKIVTTLSSSFSQVSSGMEMTCTGNEDIANTIQNIANQSQSQLSAISNTLSKMNDVSSKIENISNRLNFVEKSILNLNSSSTKGSHNLKSYNDNIDDISKSMSDTNIFIKELKSGISEISNVSEFIFEISEELKLLSLNASIEAARSGEAGKGFAIVATEITKLSETTKQGIEKINTFTSNILNNSNNVENSINESIEIFSSSQSIFDNAKNIFTEMQKQNTAILNDIEEIASDANNINLIAKDTSEMSKNIYDSSLEISDDTTNVSAVSEQLFAQFQEINDIVAGLCPIINKLETSAQIFNTGVKPADKVSDKPLKIAIMISGSTTSMFWKEVAQGAYYASKELQDKNAVVDLIRVPVGNSMEEHRDYFISLLRKCIDENVDGICLLGNFEELIPLVNEASDKGIPVITLNSDFKGYNKRIACVQQNQYDSGVVAAEELSRKLNEKGNVLLITYKEKIDSMEERIKGFKDCISNHKNIKITDTSYACDTLEETYEKFKKYLQTNTDINGIYYTARFKLAIARAIKDCGLAGKVKCIVYDIDNDTLNYINEGVLTCTIGQDPFGQGHNPVIHMYNYLVTKQPFKHEKLWTRIDVVDSDNIGSFIN